MNFGGPPVATSDSLQEYIGKVRNVSVATTPRQRSFGATIESSDPRLAAALLVEAVLPTADSHLRVAEEYRRLGILDSAHARLNRAVEKEPRLAEAHEVLARFWRDWGMPERGLGAAYRAVSYDPRSASAQNTLGTMLDALGRLGDARRAYERALQLDPTAAWALNNLCYVEFRLGPVGRGATRCEAALAACADVSSAAHNNLALTLAAAGDLDRSAPGISRGGRRGRRELQPRHRLPRGARLRLSRRRVRAGHQRAADFHGREGRARTRRGCGLLTGND